MDDSNLIETLGQVSSGEAGSIFRDFLRGGVRQLLCELMAAEVSELCGSEALPERQRKRSSWLKFRPCDRFRAA